MKLKGLFVVFFGGGVFLFVCFYILYNVLLLSHIAALYTTQSCTSLFYCWQRMK